MRTLRLRAATARLALLLVLVVAGAAGPAVSAAAPPRASLTDIENDVMCPSCRESLAVAQSPQAYAERNYIRQLIAQGLDKRQIERTLVTQYGPSVLARPPARGFDLTVYVLPAVILVAMLATLAVVLPRWRRAARDRRARPLAAAPAISAHDAGRLDEELRRFDL